LMDVPLSFYGQLKIGAMFENGYMTGLYELEGEKYSMSQPAWEKANRLSDSGMELAHKRVVADVLLQERLRDRLKGLTILKPEKTWKP